MDGYTLDMALVMAEFEGDEDVIEELESVIRDEPQYFDHMAQKLRDDRESRAKLAVLIEELTAQGNTHVEDAGHYADEENLYVSAANRADGEPATDEDANAYLIGTDYRGQPHTKPLITGWKDLGFTPKYERYSGGGTQAQKGPMNEEQKAERKTLIANNKAMESVPPSGGNGSRLCWRRSRPPRAGSTSPSTPSPTTPKWPAVTTARWPRPWQGPGSKGRKRGRGTRSGSTWPSPQQRRCCP